MPESPQESLFYRELHRKALVEQAQRHRSPMRGSSALVASARRIEAEAAQKKRTDTSGDVWQREAYRYYDEIGEIRYAARFIGNALSKLRLYVAVQPDAHSEPVPVTATDEDGQPVAPPVEAAAAEQALLRIQSPEGGLPEIQREWGINDFVVGESYLVGWMNPPHPGAEPVERWDIVSIDELVAAPDGRGWALRFAPGDTGDKLIPLGPDAFVLRIWQRHPRFSSVADSPLRAVLDLCDELQILSKMIRATALSRIPAGILLVPSEGSDGPADVNDGENAGNANLDPLSADLLEHFSAGIRQDLVGSAAQVVPFLLRGDRDDLAAVELIEFKREIDKVAGEQRKELIGRIANGLDVPPEILLGMADVNHWTAWQVDEQTYSAHVEPRAILLVQALTLGYLRPVLEAMGVQDADRYMVWFDPSALVTHPDRGAAADDAHDRLVISDEAYRRTKGFADSDAPDEDERLRRVAERNPGDAAAPPLVVDEAVGGQPGAVQPGPPPGGPPAAPDALPAAAVPPMAAQALLAASPNELAELGRRLAELDRSLRNRLLIAADAAMRRALERAGAKLRTKAKAAGGLAADAVASVTNLEVAATLGPSLIAAVDVTEDELVEGAFDDLQERFLTWTRRVQQQAMREIERLGGDFEPGALAGILAQQEEDRNDAWLLLLASLTATAQRRLFDPRPEADLKPGEPVGELDPSVLVPAGTIRQAVSRAGGATGQPSRGGAVLAPATPFPEPAGGIATGQLVTDALQTALGVVQIGWRWVYGDAGSRGEPFVPHEDLNFAEFDSWTSPVLASDGGWPFVAYYFPGDHLYCQCDFEPAFQQVDSQEPVPLTASAPSTDRRVAPTLEGP